MQSPFRPGSTANQEKLPAEHISNTTLNQFVSSRNQSFHLFDREAVLPRRDRQGFLANRRRFGEKTPRAERLGAVTPRKSPEPPQAAGRWR